MCENEIGLGVLQSSVRQTRVLQEYQRYKLRPTDYVSILSVLCETFVDFMLFNTGPEYSRSHLVFEVHNNFIFGMLYCFPLINFWHCTPLPVLRETLVMKQSVETQRIELAGA